MSNNTGLFIAGNFATLWDRALQPWFDYARRAAWRSRQPTIVLVPSRSYSFFLKSRLLESNRGFAGISFWTPGECRGFLLRQLGANFCVASREDLHLLLGTVAEQISDSPIAQAAARDPASLMRALDQVAGAGWDFQDIGGDNLKPLLEKFSRILKESGLRTSQQADQWLTSQPGPIFQSLLVAGFTGAHWPLWNLLRAAVSVAEAASLCLVASEDDDWGAAWRKIAGAQEAKPSPSRQRPTITYHIGANLREQAQAIAVQSLVYLADDSCTRLGIVVPGHGALSREVAGLLAALQIPHNDAIGHTTAAPDDEQSWRAWFELQQHGRIESFMELLRVCPAAAARFPADGAKIERALDAAFTEVLVDDLAVIAAFLSKSRDETYRTVGEAAAGFERLPEKSTLNDFLARTTSVLTALNMSERAAFVAERAVVFARCDQLEVSRELFLRWLAESTDVRSRIRDEAGNNPYARVQFLPYNQAEGQTWSHLILAGLNDGEWPPRFESSGFLSETTVAGLNKRAAAAGKTRCLGPAELRALAERTFTNLIESASIAVCATASLTSETEPDRHLVPSEYLMKLFFEDRRETLGSQQLAEVQRQSSAWLEKSRLFETEVTGDKSVAQTYRAYEARRDKTKKFEEYEFALKRAPQRPLSLPCKEWETALQDPGSVFLKRVLGVEPPRARTDEDRWSLTVGTWIHRWLRSAADPAGKRDFVKMPGPADFSRELRAAALTTQRAVAEAFAAAGRPMPRWWMAGWTEAVWKAGQLDTALAGLTDWAWFAAEWDLPDGVQAGALRLRGRIDLLLAHQPRADAGTLWVLDFKTGKTGTKLSAKKLAKGTGVQVALYALALQLLGATDVTASLVRPGEPIDAGLEHNEVAGATAVWETLAAMQNTGVFGMIGELRPEFGLPRTYPLATLAVDSETLGDKWALTHPKLQSEEDEE